ncbi:MAG: 3-isopropylmalate dehydratase [Methanomicrobiales archaeon]|nr:3-isopropylmalate dehydratase [Methanomicrobiales archaeon]MDD1659931.1 3-isopropylmalate dehydratase [Methanomicrobiales archaeon]
MCGEGRAVCLGSDVDTDRIIAGRYLRTKDRALWAAHVFEDLDPTLASRLKGTVLMAGKNMGCGSSREQAVIALKEAGVVAVIAPSFARIFFRNAINIGLPVIECQVACKEGARVRFNLAEGWVEVDGARCHGTPLSPKMLAIVRAGGLVPYWREHR